jgi:hypothetical protein
VSAHEQERDRTPGENAPARPPSQRDVVAASLLRCPRGEPEVRHGRPGARSGLPDCRRR